MRTACRGQTAFCADQSTLRRDENPAEFRRNVQYCIFFGAAIFVFNLWISWQVMSRYR